VTEHYCSAKISGERHCSIYDSGHVSDDSSIITLRLATQMEINHFFDYLDEWGYRYNLNTKKLRYVGRG
jgi:hypothetical protein